MRWRGLALAAAMLATPALAQPDETPRDEIGALLTASGIADIRLVTYNHFLPDTWTVDVQYAPRQIAPDLCLYGVTVVTVTRGEGGTLAIANRSELSEATYASCDTAHDGKQNIVVLGKEGRIPVDKLVLASDVMREIVGKTDHPASMHLRFEKNDLRTVLAGAKIGEVIEVADGGGRRVLAYLSTPDLPDGPLGLRITPRGNGAFSVYVFRQIEQLED